jgi:hypothetical protein
MKLGRAVILSVALVVGLAGCTFHASLTVPAASVAKTAAAQLQKQVGTDQPPKIDCGDKQVDLVKGKKLDCTLTDPANGTKLPVAITITKVDGLKYSIDAEVGTAPIDPSPSSTADVPAGALSVTPTDLALLAQKALDQQGSDDAISCGNADSLTIVPGAVFQCQAGASDGKSYDTTVTVTDVTGQNYSIDVKVSATPQS